MSTYSVAQTQQATPPSQEETHALPTKEWLEPRLVVVTALAIAASFIGGQLNLPSWLDTYLALVAYGAGGFYALTEARKIEFAEEELPALIALAEMRRQQAKLDEARARLDEVWDLAERGPYPLFHADAYNVLAQIERDAGHTQAAIDAATQAYQYAWCDGPPWAYHWGLEKAKSHLAALGAPEPNMPPFSIDSREPMPDVEINPKDEYWVDPEGLG